MAADTAQASSPRLSPKHGHAFNPATPVHSPQHSLHSASSSRTPIHTLSLHEYRRLQNTPTLQSATPPGKSLRRKAAASALNELERVPSISRTPVSGSCPSSRPLHFSQSTHHLSAYQPLPPSPPDLFEQTGLSDGPFRSQSAEPRKPRTQSSDYRPSFEAETFQTSKVGNWKPGKRLPKPPFVFSRAHISSALIPDIPTPRPTPVVPVRTTPTSSLKNVASTEVPATTPSAFSLSKFPHPPHVIDPSFSLPNDENVPPHLTTSFATTAPATPPATPAVIHYRGASFDLVNPHDSLLFHDIVTPSRDLDSSEYLPLRSSEEPLLPSEMATPRRPLYGDLSSAYSSIRGRDDSPVVSSPQPPPPAVLSPESSIYSSPGYTEESNLAVSPLKVKKAGADSRFSLKELTPIKQLTNSITKKFGKTPEPEEQELEELPVSRARPATSNLEGDYPRSLDETYPISPVQSYQPNRILRTGYYRYEEPTLSARDSRPDDQPYSSGPLTSMIPDDPSLQAGRGDDVRSSVALGEVTNRPYYDEVSSLYQSSSIYTGDGDGSNRGYPDSLYSQRMSNNPYGAADFQDSSYSPYQRGSIYSYSNNRLSNRYSQATTNRMSNPYSRPPTQDFSGRSQQPSRNGNTDTVSKIIDQYGSEQSIGAAQTERPPVMRGSSGLGKFEFELEHTSSGSHGEASLIPTIHAGRARKATITHPAGLPLRPAFEYDEIPGIGPAIYNRPDASDLLSGFTSYDDTRQLLGLSQPLAADNAGDSTTIDDALPAAGEALEPSSSYSQPDVQPESQMPQEALDQAEQIFEQAEIKNQNDGIPAIWSRRGSGNLLRDNRCSAAIEETEEEKGDWETLGNNSGTGRPSMDDSIADCSDTTGRGSLSMDQEDSLPALPAADRDHSLYCHPSPLRAPHDHPFDSSPPIFSVQSSVRTAPGEHRTTFVSPSSPYSSTMPLFRTVTRGLGNEAYNNGPLPDLYAFSDKETQDLLNSGPNDDIFYEDQQESRRFMEVDEPNDNINSEAPNGSLPKDEDRPLTFSPFHEGYNNFVMRPDYSFEKLSTLGPKGNLTGTPQGTGMHEAGSSVADTSSPGAVWSSTPNGRQRPAGYSGFYAEPGQTSSNNMIPPARRHMAGFSPETHHERSPSQVTLFPRYSGLQSIPDNPSPLSDRPRSVRSVSVGRSYGHSRSAVAGQTRLREMMLLSDTHTMSSGHSTHLSQFNRDGISERPSTGYTDTPLRRPRSQYSRPSQLNLRQPIATEFSPHLLCPERVLDPEEEAARTKLSWYLFACFCLFPPAIILFRFLGDQVIVNVSRGRFGHAATKPKNLAVLAGFVANFCIALGIAIPIIVTNVKPVVA